MTMRTNVLASMDSYGIIGQQDYPKEHNDGIDGGDSVNRMGHYQFLIQANKEIGNNIGEVENLPSRTKEEYEKQLEMFQDPNSKGNYRRHPAVTEHGIAYYSNGTYDGVMSRDQSIPLVISLAFLGFYKKLFFFFIRHLMRGLLFTTNTRPNHIELRPKKLPDFTGPEFWALYIRSNYITGILFYPLLCLFDIETLIGSIIRRFNTNDDVINHLSICIYGRMRFPTPIIWLACKINSYDNMIAKLISYSCGWRKIPFFVDLYEPLVAKYMK